MGNEAFRSIDDSAASSSAKGGASSSPSSSPLLPTTDISEEALCRLDAELHAFANYVRLSSVEADARSYVVNHVRELANELFGNGGKSNVVNSAGRKRRRRLDTWSDHEGDEDDINKRSNEQGDDDDDEDGIRVVCFGSFAAPEVCTFLSDVDLALWGVVPPPDPLGGGGSGTHTRFGEDDHGDEDSADDEAPKMSHSALQRTMEALDAAQTARSVGESGSAKNKEERVQRLRNALSAGDASNDFPAAGDVGDGQPASGGGTEGLFVIDREGEFDNVEADNGSGNEGGAKDDGANGDSSATAAQLNDQSSREEEKKEEVISPTKGGITSNEAKSSNFLFAIDREGAQELGHDEKETETPANETTEDVDNVEGNSDSVIDLCACPDEKQVDEKDQVPSEDAQKEKSGKNEVIEISSGDEDKGESEDDSLHRDGTSLSDDDDDNADKMEGFRRDRQKGKEKAVSDSEQQYTIDLLSDSSNSDDDSDDALQDRLREFMAADIGDVGVDVDDEDDDVEVSLVIPRGGAAENSNIKRPAVGPTGKTKVKVVSALKRLGKKLWASQLTDTVEVRRHAKVPIVTCATRLGFDGDIAIAGHIGADTSKYASSQVCRYDSFAPVVLLLKIILYQTDLDKPFTGGLGSYKLYVLVAHHLDQHIALGGADRPAEVFASFLYRYGAIKGYRQRCHQNSVTTLGQTTTLTSHDNGHADMMPVFHLSHCVKVFERCFWRLMQRFQRLGSLSSQKRSGSGPSLLGNLVNCTKLSLERKSCLSKAERVRDMSMSKPFIGRNHPGKVNAGRKIGHVFSKEGRSFNAGVASPASASGRTTPQRRGNGAREPSDTDEEAEQLMAGYGVQRGARGTLVPKYRPDVEARREAIRDDPTYELRGRASKNRSSKKKQKRDTAIKEFAMKKF